MSLNFEYPNDYLSYVKEMNDNEFNSDSGYIELFPLDELEKINKEYEIDIYIPNYFVIGTNGGGVGIFFNKNDKKVYSIPFVGMEEEDAVLLANSFLEFLYKFENDGLEIY